LLWINFEFIATVDATETGSRAIVFKRSSAVARIDLQHAHRVDNFAAHSAFTVY
jgi:hypothetical protein